MIQIFNENLEFVGLLEEFNSFSSSSYYCDVGTFKIEALLTDRTVELLKPYNFIRCMGFAGMIDSISKNESEDGAIITASGTDCSGFLYKRVCNTTIKGTNRKRDVVAYDIVNTFCANPSDSKRKFPFLECAASGGITSTTENNLGNDTCYEELRNILLNYDLGFKTEFNPKEKKLVFKVYQGADKTRDIVIGKNFDNVTTQTYTFSSQETQNFVYAIAEEATVTAYLGQAVPQGWHRGEYLVDSSLHVEDENIGTLANLKAQLTAEAKAELEDDVNCFDIDSNESFTVGDLVTIRDKSWGISESQRVTRKDITIESGVLTYSYMIGQDI